MEEEETLKERQENELVLLQAIFMDSLEDLRQKDTWKVWRPPEIRITLQPQQSMTTDKEIYVQVDLHIKCNQDYPKKPPTILLENAKGLSNILVEELRSQLQSVSTMLKGEVMILELTQHVQKFLHENNNAPAKSFYEEMVSNQRRQEAEQARVELQRQEMEKKHQELQHKEIQEEIHRKQEALREARRKRSLSKNLNSEDRMEEGSNDLKLSSSLPNIHSQNVPPSVKSENALNRQKQSICGHSGIVSLSFHERTIQRGKCLAHSPRGCVTFLGLDSQLGEMVVVIEWVLKLSPFKKKMTSEEQDAYQKQRDNYLKQISFMQQEIASFYKLDHTHLARYLSIEHSTERDQITVHVLQEHVSGFTLGSHLNNKEPIEMSVLRHYTEEIVEALFYLHENTIIHRDLRATSLLLDNKGAVKMIDYSIDKRLFDLHNSSRKEVMNGEYPPPSGRGGKKGDVHRLGIIVLSLSSGKLVKDIYPLIPITLPPELQDFLKICLQPNEKERWTVAELRKHSFLKPKLILNPSPEKLELEKANHIVDPVMVNAIINERFGSTRLHNEFEVLQWLGKGGFGDVLKVRNKLDGRVYALKRILLNPSKLLLNRKIMREVKLLSRLNHENVVRYYNSWIETSMEILEEDTSTNRTTSQSEQKNKSESDKVEMPSNQSSSDDIEKFAPPEVEGSIDWSVSYDFGPEVQDEFDSSDDDDDDFVFSASVLSKPDQSDAGSILFEQDDSKTSSDVLKPNSILTDNESKSGDQLAPRLNQFMFIQMEFCEKSTLRTAIDEGLYQEPQRMWRLFREVIEGLLHIHQQGMIHRDLKPVNIFLDSNDHVKIGDFGLATTDMMMKSSLLDTSNTASFGHILDLSVMDVSDFIGDGTQTGRVGTALYVAPELITSSGAKSIYNQKVDIYSLGIIFFEMCYPVPSTGMERIKFLINLRQQEIVLPSDAHIHLTTQQIEVIKWLLQHNITQRPNAEQLLASDYLPPPHLEEAELNEVLRHTVSNPQSRAYKRMIKSLFRQEVTPAADFSYDMDVHKLPHSSRYTWAFNATVSTIQKLVHRHGALLVSVPTLMPKCQIYHHNDFCVSLMDHSGGIVTLPSDLRVSFARYVARREVHQMKRYTIERVYRERKVYGCHPREVYECAFDIVTSSPGNLLPDAEVISVISELISEFPLLQQSQECYIRINHKNLFLSILIYCGIPEEKHSDVLVLLSDTKAQTRSRLQVQTKLQNLGLSEQSICMLLQFTEVEDSLQKIQSLIRPITKKRGQNTSLAIEAIRNLETIISYVEAFGVKLSIVVAPGLVFGMHTYSGMMFQFVCEVKRKNQKVKRDILAEGGRYDSLVSLFGFNSLSSGSREPSHCAVGVSIALDKICTGYVQQENSSLKWSTFDVMICSVGSSPMLKEKCDVLQRLWVQGVSAQVIYDCSLSLEEVMAFCREMNISNVLILKDLDFTHIKLRILEKDRFTEKKISLNELMDYIDQLEGSTNSRQEVNRSYSTGDAPERLSATSQSSSSGPSVKITFLPLEKISVPNKRRHDALIQTYLTSILPQLSTKAVVEVIAVDLGVAVIRSIASHLELDIEEEEYKLSLSMVIDKHPRHRKYLAQLWDLISSICIDKKYPILVLYGLVDNNCKIIFKTK